MYKGAVGGWVNGRHEVNASWKCSPTSWSWGASAQTKGGTSMPASPAPETNELRCPSCQSARVAPAEHFIVSGGVVVRKEHRCAACGAVFWVRANDERLPADLE